jgi:hypothetical protein
MPRQRTILLVAAALTIIALGASRANKPPDPDASLSGEEVPAADPGPTRVPGALARADIPKGEWPLTVSHGVVRCEGTSVIFRANGRDYAVNGTAQMLHKEMAKIHRIWRRDPDVPGLRINIGPVLDKGLELC